MNCFGCGGIVSEGVGDGGDVYHYRCYDQVFLKRRKEALMKDAQLHSQQKQNPLATQIGGDHYKKLKIQPIEYAYANGLNFFQTNVVKYATRYKDKGKPIEDLKKIIHYCQLEIQHLESLSAAAQDSLSLKDNPIPPPGSWMPCGQLAKRQGTSQEPGTEKF